MNASFLKSVCSLAGAAFALLAAFCLPAQADILYGATSGGPNGEFVILNPANGAVLTDIGPLVDGKGLHYSVTGLDFQPGTGVLFGASARVSATNPQDLVTINPASGIVTDVGSFGLG